MKGKEHNCSIFIDKSLHFYLTVLSRLNGYYDKVLTEISLQYTHLNAALTERTVAVRLPQKEGVEFLKNRSKYKVNT